MADITVLSESELEVTGKRYRCAIGKAGFVAADEKREGDHKTPVGSYALRSPWARLDKLQWPEGATQTPREIQQEDGWCDAPSHERYNEYVTLPFDASHEKLWHNEDDCYDVIVPIGYNDVSPCAGAGSAIFFHIAHDDYRGTEGCIAVSKADMLKIIPHLDVSSLIHILPKKL